MNLKQTLKQRLARRPTTAAVSGGYHVVVPARAFRVFEEQALGLGDCLEAVGRAPTLHRVRRMRQVGRLHSGDRVIVFAPHRLDAFEPVDGVLYTAVNDFPYPDPGNAESGRPRAPIPAGYHLVFESHEALYDRAKRLDLHPAGVLPFACGPRWEWDAAPVSPRYDVAFLGRVNTDHRRELWANIRERFKTCPQTEAWGRRRAALLRSARIQLSFAATEVHELPGHRFAMALANCCFVLSEPLPPGSPFRPGAHYAEATASGMIDAIARYLERHEQRQAVAEAGHRFFTTEYRLEGFVKRMLPVLDFAVEAIREGRNPRVAKPSDLRI